VPGTIPSRIASRAVATFSAEPPAISRPVQDDGAVTGTGVARSPKTSPIAASSSASSSGVPAPSAITRSISSGVTPASASESRMARAYWTASGAGFSWWWASCVAA
jgi:hypothetical protein